MARSTTKKDTDDGPVVVDLTHPDGERHYEAGTPRELYNLVSGHGYRITEDGLTIEEAAERLAVNVSGSGTAGTAGAGAAPDAGTTPSTTTTATTTTGTTT